MERGPARGGGGGGGYVKEEYETCGRDDMYVGEGHEA